MKLRLPGFVRRWFNRPAPGVQKISTATEAEQTALEMLAGRTP